MKKKKGISMQWLDDIKLSLFSNLLMIKIAIMNHHNTVVVKSRSIRYNHKNHNFSQSFYVFIQLLWLSLMKMNQKEKPISKYY